MKVSVLMITYNHEEFISQAIDSILMQKTNFPYEIVIGEDCSTDKTRDIIIDYKKKYPDKFQLLLNETNLGMHKNGAQTYEACKGQYLAFLEGDDYWTSPDKLQKQVDFLDNHPESAICFHNVMEIYKDGSREPHEFLPKNRKEFYSIEDLFQGNFMPTPSTMFRNGLVTEIPDWFSTLSMGDWPLYILLALHGNIGYIDEVMAVHRNHEGGVWTILNSVERGKAFIPVYDHLYTHLGPRYRGIIALKRYNMYIHIASLYEAMGDLADARKYALMAFTKHFKLDINIIKLLVKLYIPWLKPLKRPVYTFLNNLFSNSTSNKKH
jgi:glycosyltransferase involved in cell wall biosynthesis